MLLEFLKFITSIILDIVFESKNLFKDTLINLLTLFLSSFNNKSLT